MKTLEEVNEQYAKELGFDSWEQLKDMQTKNAVSKHWSKTAKIFAIEVAKESLRLRFQENNPWANSSTFNSELPSEELKYIPKI